MAKKNPSGRFISRKEAGDHLGVSAHTIQSLIEQGNLQAYRIGRQVRIERAALENCLDTSKITVSLIER